jgi:hypothetical protein
MNFIDAAGVLADSAQLLIDDKMAHEARAVVQELVAAYDALPPKINEWPDDAQWYAIDANEEATWFEVKPKMYSNEWWDKSGWPDEYGKAIPSGVDWRLCLWKRPEVIE